MVKVSSPHTHEKYYGGRAMSAAKQAAISYAGVTRAAVAVAVAASAAIGLASSSQIRSRNLEQRVTVLYVGAEDCAPCRLWRRKHWAKFQTSPEFARLVYREVISPKLFDLLGDDHWPEKLRAYRSTLGRGSGVPVWLVVTNDEIVLTARGLGVSFGD